jgi:hypothetical protein
MKQKPTNGKISRLGLVIGTLLGLVAPDNSYGTDNAHGGDAGCLSSVINSLPSSLVKSDLASDLRSRFDRAKIVLSQRNPPLVPYLNQVKYLLTPQVIDAIEKAKVITPGGYRVKRKILIDAGLSGDQARAVLLGNVCGYSKASGLWNRVISVFEPEENPPTERSPVSSVVNVDPAVSKVRRDPHIIPREDPIHDDDSEPTLISRIYPQRIVERRAPPVELVNVEPTSAELEKKGMLQEAAWQARSKGNYLKAIELEDELDYKLTAMDIEGTLTSLPAGPVGSYMGALKDGTLFTARRASKSLVSDPNNERAAFLFSRYLRDDRVPVTVIRDLPVAVNITSGSGEPVQSIQLRPFSIQYFVRGSHPAGDNGIRTLSNKTLLFDYLTGNRTRVPEATLLRDTPTLPNSEILSNQSDSFSTRTGQRMLAKMGIQDPRVLVPDSQTLQQLKVLDLDHLYEMLSPFLTDTQIEAIIERRDHLLHVLAEKKR